MEFVVIGYDGSDENALARRMAAREDHIALSAEMARDGHQKMAAALLDDHEKMTGSVIIVDFPSRTELDAWLENEPYIKGRVWEKVHVYPCKISPAFQQVKQK
ncbi:MAG: hypothetical protein H6853_02615 [Rhodospirillales bacterium]|nr:hypothetical protein [Alphaproteobacteria bacterium]USO04183.1 MAG: hypothetical protein H6853_02615 [Rhodospirillales bacterium]